MPAGSRMLAGRYRLEEVVGRGGMSTVYRATDTTLGRRVAVKVLLDALAEEDPSYVARFEREARAAAALKSPAVTTIFDTGTDGESRYIVMEYVDGESLARRLRRAGPLPPAEAMRIGAAVADVLATAHAAGILHRDVKPANVMLTASGLKVLDFGIARPLHDATLTQTTSLVGTAAYMAPERVAGGSGDERSDLYSLGCLLYALLTGTPPFGGDHPAAVLHQQVTADPPPARERVAAVPAGLDALILQMLAKDPAARPQTAADVRDRLEEMREPTAATAPLTARSAPPASPGSPAPIRARVRTPVLALLAAALVLIAIAVALLVSGGRPAAHNTPRVTARSTPAATSTSPARTTAPAATGPAPPAKKKPPAAGPPGHGGGPPGQKKPKKPKPGH